MKITQTDADQFWLQVGAHTTARKKGNNTGAPWPLQVQVAALVGNSKIEASHTTFSSTAPSTWTVTLVTTDERLIRVCMQFDAEQYDLEQDIGVAGQDSVQTTVSESWVRRLNDVVGLAIGGARMRPDTFDRTMRDVLDLADVSLTFRDGAVVDLDFDQLGMTAYDDRPHSDRFLDAVRKHTGL